MSPVAALLYMESITQRDRWVNRSPVPECAGVSAELRAANARLLAQRKQGHSTATRSLRPSTQPHPAERKRLPASGWMDALHDIGLEATPLVKEAPATASSLLPETVTVLPTMASAYFKEGCVAEARLWYLCRLVDQDGRGWLSVDTVRARFAHRESALRIAGWRRVRQLLQQGRGVFWQRDDQGRVWLNSAENVAHKLGITKLSGRPVKVPVSQLVANLRSAKAHLYTTFHSGRRSTPISRTTLSTTTGVPERTQRTYDALTHIARQSNIAVGAAATTAARHEHFAQRPGAFELIDHKGKQGPAGTRYQAWRLPNSYGNVHDVCQTGHQKRINRRLRRIDLANQRVQGNDVLTSKRRVFIDGSKGTQRRDDQAEQYFRNTILGVWHCLRLEKVRCAQE